MGYVLIITLISPGGISNTHSVDFATKEAAEAAKANHFKALKSGLCEGDNFGTAVYSISPK